MGCDWMIDCIPADILRRVVGELSEPARDTAEKTLVLPVLLGNIASCLAGA